MLGFIRRLLEFCGRHRGRPPEQVILEHRVEELQATVNKMAYDLRAIMQDLAGQNLDIHIDKVFIDKVNLEQLNFNIDGIGVRDLSGSLSIGLNYGGKVVRLNPCGVPGPPPGRGEVPHRPRPLARGQPRIRLSTETEEGDNRDQRA